MWQRAPRHSRASTETRRSGAGVVISPVPPRAVGHNLAMLISGPYPFVGEVVWLTPEQGGRTKGVPPVVEGLSYTHVAYVPPFGLAEGAASFVLRSWNPEAWRSPAEGRWLFAENEGLQNVRPGSMIVVAEGPRTVAYFTVHSVSNG